MTRVHHQPTLQAAKHIEFLLVIVGIFEKIIFGGFYDNLPIYWFLTFIDRLNVPTSSSRVGCWKVENSISFDCFLVDRPQILTVLLDNIRIGQIVIWVDSTSSFAYPRLFSIRQKLKAKKHFWHFFSPLGRSTFYFL